MNKTISFCFLILSFILIINLFRDVWRLIQAEERIIKTEQELNYIAKKNKEFIKTEDYYKSDAFLEEQIRNKLQMAKEKETILILPEEINEIQLDKLEQFQELKQISNWQKWLALFK